MTEDIASYSSFVPGTEAAACLLRIFQAAQCHTQKELAAFLGVGQSAISDAKKRESIPAEWLLPLLRKKWINPTWILTGQGVRFLQPGKYSASPFKGHSKSQILESALAEQGLALPCAFADCSTEALLAEVMHRVLRERDVTKPKKASLV